MDVANALDAYLVYVWIRDIHPLLWRRFLVRADSTLADLHWIFQIAFGWTDYTSTRAKQCGGAAPMATDDGQMIAPNHRGMWALLALGFAVSPAVFYTLMVQRIASAVNTRVEIRFVARQTALRPAEACVGA
jgi:hypothetical protein